MVPPGAWIAIVEVNAEISLGHLVFPALIKRGSWKKLHDDFHAKFKSDQIKIRLCGQGMFAWEN
jgi:hypothetical protein